MALINFSGIASGIDTTALIDAILEQQREVRVSPNENRKTELEESNDALNELTGLLNNLDSSIQSFRVLNGGVVAKEAISSDETNVIASASNTASTGSYSVNVNQLASNGILSFDDRFVATSSAINSSIFDGAAAADRTTSVTIGTGADQETVDVVLTSTTTAQEYVESFNSQSTKATASLVNLGTESSPSYGILITSNDEGTELGTISHSVGSEITSAGAGAFASFQEDQATNAQFTIDGISGTIVRGSNTVADVIGGVSLAFQSTGSSTVTIDVDSDTTASSMEEFVDAFNEVINFIKENDLVEQTESNGEKVSVFGSLSGVSVDENIISSIKSALVDAGITGGEVNIFADLGITTERDGTLKFEAEKFAEALARDPASVETITQNLGENLGAVDGTISSFTRFNGLIDVVENSNSSLIKDLQSRIQQTEEQLAKQEESLMTRFARLESVIGQMQAQQSAITSAVAGLA